MATQIQHRRGTAAQWTSANPVLAEGEEGFETNTSKRKVGDGATAWNGLPYLSLLENDAVIDTADATARSGVWLPARGISSLTPPTKRLASFQAGHGATAVGTQITLTDDTSIYSMGTQSLKAVTDGTGVGGYVSLPSWTARDMSASMIRIVFRVENPANAAITTCQCYVKATASNVWQATLNLGYAGTANLVRAGDWHVMTLPRSAFTVAAGTINWAAVTQIQIRVVDTGGVPLTVYFQAVDQVPDTPSGLVSYPNGVFSMTMDDGYAAQITRAKPVLDARGIPATVYLIAERVGASGGPTLQQLKDAQRLSGWQISAHMYSQANHDYSPGGVQGLLDANTFERDVLKLKHWLRANGFHRGAEDFAGGPGPDSAQPEGPLLEVVRRYFRSGRSVVSTPCETIPPPAPHKLRAFLYTGQSVATIQAAIDKAVGAGAWFVFVCHDIAAGASSGATIGTTDLGTILDYVQTTKAMATRTVGDVLEGR